MHNCSVAELEILKSSVINLSGEEPPRPWCCAPCPLHKSGISVGEWRNGSQGLAGKLYHVPSCAMNYSSQKKDTRPMIVLVEGKRYWAVRVVVCVCVGCCRQCADATVIVMVKLNPISLRMRAYWTSHPIALPLITKKTMGVTESGLRVPVVRVRVGALWR